MRIRRYTKNRRGAGMVEYGLIVGLIAVGAIIAVQNSGDRVSGLLNTVAADLGTVVKGIDAPVNNAVAPGEPEVNGVLTIGDTVKVVERDGIQVRCGEWDGRRCRLPEVRAASNPCSGIDHDPTEWHEVWGDATDASVDDWCHIATGESLVAYTASYSTPRGPMAWNMNPRNTCGSDRVDIEIDLLGKSYSFLKDYGGKTAIIDCASFGTN